MRLIFRFYTNTLAFLGISTVDRGRSFFEYSAKEKKQIIKQAAEDANKMQQELVEKYYRQNPKERAIKT